MPSNTPEDFKPRNYQTYTINFIKQHPKAAIFLDMGMGKTVSTLTALDELMHDHFEVQKPLVIAPLRVARDTWPAEVKKWNHLKNLRISLIWGTPKQRKKAIQADADIYVINVENTQWLVKELQDDWPFDAVVIDELSTFKNHDSKRFKALMSTRQHMDRLIGLTGTPTSRSLEDLWAPFKLFDGGQRLGQYITHFRHRYFTPDKRNGHQVYSWKLKPEGEEGIYEAIGDITVSMQSSDHLELPPLTISTKTVYLDEKERKAYDRFKREMVIEMQGETIDAGNAAVLSNKLLQLSSGSIYVDQGRTVSVHSQKLDALEDLIESANGHTVLVAYWFKHELERLQRRFPTGRQLSSSQDITDWCNGDIPIGFIHPASAGHGLNLQSGGHIMVWYTTPWSLELYQQTNARLHRQGQTQPVTIVHIEVDRTIDQQVIKSLESKNETQTALINAVKVNLGE